MIRTWILAGSVAILTGCTLTLPVRGEFEQGSEQFLGEATGKMSGDGTLSVQTAAGVTCAGTFQYAKSHVTGEGAMRCSDGRVGDFFFTSNGTEGQGFGRTEDGGLFQFKFGGPEYTAARAASWAAMAASFDDAAKALNPPTTYCTQFGNSYRCTHRGF